MNIKFLTIASLLFLLVTSSNSTVYAESHDEQEEVLEEGPNHGRMLRDEDFAIEITIYESGVAPEFRVFATYAGKPVNTGDVELDIELTRIDGEVDNIQFISEDHYLRGDRVVIEPHSFEVMVTARYNDMPYQWSYDSFEGRTKIDSSVAESMIIITEKVTKQTFSETLQVYGQLVTDPNAIRHVSARFPGEIKKLAVSLGQKVKKGQLLITVESNESLQRYPIYAPISGLITYQNAGTGEQTGVNKLLTITDTRHLIAELQVFPKDQKKVRPNASVDIYLSDRDTVVKSQLFDSLFNVNDQQARTYRAKISNPDGIFNSGQFISGQIHVNEYEVPLAVKKTGLQGFRDFTVVFAKFDDEYEVRMLELGRSVGAWVEVLGGVKAGTKYVVNNSYLIKADIEKSGASHDH